MVMIQIRRMMAMFKMIIILFISNSDDDITKTVIILTQSPPDDCVAPSSTCESTRTPSSTGRSNTDPRRIQASLNCTGTAGTIQSSLGKIRHKLYLVSSTPEVENRLNHS